MLTAAALGMFSYGIYSIVWAAADLARGARLEIWAELGLIVFDLSEQEQRARDLSRIRTQRPFSQRQCLLGVRERRRIRAARPKTSRV